jgi:hypothetical protein
VNYQLSLDHGDLAALVSMGPSARHITPQALAARARSLSTPFTVTVDLQIRVFTRLPRRSDELCHSPRSRSRATMPVDNEMLG